MTDADLRKMAESAFAAAKLADHVAPIVHAMEMVAEACSQPPLALRRTVTAAVSALRDLAMALPIANEVAGVADTLLHIADDLEFTAREGDSDE